MQTDTISYDTLESRPLPKWLTDQKTGVTTIKPREIIMKEDNSLKISFLVTALIIIFFVIMMTVIILRKKKNREL